MRARFLLYAAIALSVLVPILAGPVQADEDVAMWVHRARLAYLGRSSGGPDAVEGLIHIRDATLAMVTEATVTVEWTLPDGTVREETADTGFQGIARFSVWEGRGTYQLCVIGVVKDGWVYDPGLDRESCPVFIVQ